MELYRLDLSIRPVPCVSLNFDAMNEIIYAASPTINYENVTLEAQSGHQRNTSLVDFDGAEDPANPLNWSPVYKWSIVGLISVMSLVV